MNQRHEHPPDTPAFVKQSGGVDLYLPYTLFNYFYFFFSQPVQPENYLVDKLIRILNPAHEWLQFIRRIVIPFLKMPIRRWTLGVVSIPELLLVLTQYINQLLELMVVVLPHRSLINHIIHGSACFAFQKAKECFYPSILLLIHLYHALCQMCEEVVQHIALLRLCAQPLAYEI